MELWFTENHSPHEKMSWRVREYLYSRESAFQKVDVIDTIEFGRMLVLDGFVMTTEKDEWVYHEMLSHMSLMSHPNPRRVLIIGGGDGGVLREVVKHPTVEKAVMVEIDGEVIEVCREYLPSIASAFDDPRAEVIVGDGVDYVANAADESFDAVLVDGTDPIGPGEGLFNEAFYRHVHRILTPEGITATHTSESAFFKPHVLEAVYTKVNKVFPGARLFRADIPTYHTGTWFFAMGCKGGDPATRDYSQRWNAKKMACKYYNPEMHRAAFAMPPFVWEIIGKS